MECDDGLGQRRLEPDATNLRFPDRDTDTHAIVNVDFTNTHADNPGNTHADNPGNAHTDAYTAACSWRDAGDGD
jgi:hypothetical protein